MKNKYIVIVCFLNLLLVVYSLTGCVKLDKSYPYPEKRHFVIKASRHIHEAPSETKNILWIPKFRVSPRYEGKGFAYRTGNLTYKSDFYNVFFVSPDSLITEEIRGWITASGLFNYVMETPGQLYPTHILDGSIDALYGDYRSKTSPKAVMEIKFRLVRDEPTQPKILFQNLYREEIPLKDVSTEALVKGWDKALQCILAALENDLKKVSQK